jgi:hypothetical protein
MHFKKIFVFIALSMVIGFFGCTREKVEAPERERITKQLIPPKAEVKGTNFLIELSDLEVITLEDKASKERILGCSWETNRFSTWGDNNEIRSVF